VPRVPIWIRFGARDVLLDRAHDFVDARLKSQPFESQLKLAGRAIDMRTVSWLSSLAARLMLCNRAGSENRERKEVSQMKKTISLLSNLLLTSMLFERACRGSEPARRDGSHRLRSGLLPHEICPDKRATLSWDRPELNSDAEKSIDFYGPCDYDPTGPAEVRAQRAILLRQLFGDGAED
jgi:hypothetical protein